MCNMAGRCLCVSWIKIGYKQVVGDYMNRLWLLENAHVAIRYILTKDTNYLYRLLENQEVQYWLSHLKKRSDENNVHAIHGSHDFRMENVLGKCWILGLSREIPEFHRYMQ